MIQKFIASLFVLSAVSAASAGPLSRLQEDMIRGSTMGPLRSQELEHLKVVRLWGLDTPQLVNDQVMGTRLVNQSVAGSVLPLYCPSNSKTYARFSDRGKIVSDETFALGSLLEDLNPSYFEKKAYWSKKVYNKLSELYSDTLPAVNFDTSVRENPRLTSDVIKKYNSHIKYTSSFINIKETGADAGKIYSSDYTVGGWFKPTVFDGNHQERMTLLKKYYSDTSGDQTVTEWEIFVSGSTLFFHNYRDGYGPVAMKYLTEDEAQVFRAQNSDLFGFFDYREDVLQRQKQMPPVMVSRYMEAPILPSKKTDPKPAPIPMPLPAPIPPAREIPVPIPGGRVVGGVGQVGKEYTSNITLDTFWGADTLGRCYNCADHSRYAENTKMEAWYYISFSVHLNDPLGPYVDFWVVRDPNPIFFGYNADYSTHVKHRRWELDRKMLSYSNLNPVQFSHEIERKCKGTQGHSCVRSVLEIGSNSGDRSYSGYMRGVYIAKKAFAEGEALALAKRFYPDDRDGVCTYSKSPEFRKR